MNISFGFSPCPNDTFAFDALVHGRTPAPFTAVPALHDIEELNALAREGRYELTKLSFGALAGVRDRYTLLRSGGALGHGCGPLVVAREPASLADAALGRMAIPGRDTTAYLLLRLAAPALGEVVELRYDEILDAVAPGAVDAGPDHPREPLHLRRPRAGRGRRPGRLVGGRDRYAGAAGGHLRARGHGRRAARRRRGCDPPLRRARLRASRRQPGVRARALPGAVRRGLPAAHRPLRQRVHARPRRRGDGRDRRAAGTCRRELPRDQRALARDGRRRAPAGRAGTAAVRLLRLRAHSRHAAAAVRRAGRGRLPDDVLPELDDAPPRVVAVLIDALGWAFVERFAERAPLLARSAPTGCRLEVDDAISFDDDRARHDTSHRATGRASTAPTSGTSTSRRSTA